jgi:membrane protein YdbS with pleckstrin-like domain
VTRRDRQLLLFAETRTEAPIDMVQDVTVDSNAWGRLFGFGDVTIRTAVKIGAIVFAHVPNPEAIRHDILAGRGTAAAVVLGRQKEMLRRGLMGELRLALPVPERVRALGTYAPTVGPRRWWHRLRPKAPAPPTTPTLLPGATRGRPSGCLALLSQPLPERWRKVLVGAPPPPPQPLAGQVLWRKHPFNMIQRAWAPFLTVLFVVLIAIFGLGFLGDLLRTEGPGIWAVWLLSLAAAGIWLWWQIEDYRNDIYVVTDDRVIDIEMSPLGLRYKKREGPLDRVLTVDAIQLGIWAKVFNYGNVIIRTAAADEGYDFLMVPNPRQVQAVVFQKMDALRRRQEARRATERQRELIEGLEIYHELREGR